MQQSAPQEQTIFLRRFFASATVPIETISICLAAKRLKRSKWTTRRKVHARDRQNKSARMSLEYKLRLKNILHQASSNQGRECPGRSCRGRPKNHDLEENHLESQSKPDLRLDPQLQRGYSLYDAYAGGGHTLDL